MTTMSLRKFCRVYFELEDGDEPTKAQENTVSKMFRDGSVKGAFKLGRKWFVDYGIAKGEVDGKE